LLPRERIVLKAFDKFHAGRPQIDEVHRFDVPEDATKLIGLFFDSREIPDPASGNKGTNFAHYRNIDDLLAAGRVERDVKKRAAIYAEAQKRLERDLVCLPISDVPGSSA
jgi:ABC-type transport system substrate-binding protein